jgi:hypothetical protein
MILSQNTGKEKADNLAAGTPDVTHPCDVPGVRWVHCPHTKAHHYTARPLTELRGPYRISRRAELLPLAGCYHAYNTRTQLSAHCVGIRTRRQSRATRDHRSTARNRWPPPGPRRIRAVRRLDAVAARRSPGRGPGCRCVVRLPAQHQPRRSEDTGDDGHGERGGAGAVVVLASVWTVTVGPVLALAPVAVSPVVAAASLGPGWRARVRAVLRRSHPVRWLAVTPDQRGRVGRFGGGSPTPEPLVSLFRCARSPEWRRRLRSVAGPGWPRRPDRARRRPFTRGRHDGPCRDDSGKERVGCQSGDGRFTDGRAGTCGWWRRYAKRGAWSVR